MRLETGGRSELLRRIAFTLCALVVYRAATLVPLPGINPLAWAELVKSQAGGVLGQASTLSGGAVSRLAIVSLGILPFISAAVLIQLAGILSTSLREFSRQGRHGRAIIDRATRVLAVVLAAIQAYAVAVGLEGVGGVVSEPGALFRVSTVLTLVAGTMLVVWLADQITLRGIGNGLALILFTAAVVEIPSAAIEALALSQSGFLSGRHMAAAAAFCAAIVVLVVVMERAERSIAIRYRKPGVADPSGTMPSRLRMKLNPAGIMPVILATWSGLILLTLLSFVDGPAWLMSIVAQFGYGRPVYWSLYSLLIFFFVFFYTAFLLDPQRIADDIAKRGGAIEEAASVGGMAQRLDHAVSRAAFMGAAYLTIVCVVPEMVIRYLEMPFYVGGMPLLIVVCTVLDVIDRVQMKRAR
jgi:preprotein translocase subunit SecY